MDPPAYLFPPDIMPGADEWLAGFWEAHNDRPLLEGGFVGPIPSATLARMAQEWPEEADIWTACARAMDAIVIEDAAERAKAAMDGRPRPEHPRKIMRPGDWG